MSFGQFISNPEYLDAVITFKFYIDEVREQMPLEERLEITFEQEKKVFNSWNHELLDFNRWIKGKLTPEGVPMMHEQQLELYSTHTQYDIERDIVVINRKGAATTITKTYTVNTVKTSRFHRKYKELFPGGSRFVDDFQDIIRPEHYWQERDADPIKHSMAYGGPEEMKLAPYPGVNTWVFCSYKLVNGFREIRPWHVSRFSKNGTDYGWSYHGKALTFYDQLGERIKRNYHHSNHSGLEGYAWGQTKQLPANWHQVIQQKEKWPANGSIVDMVITPEHQWSMDREGYSIGTLNPQAHGTMWFRENRLEPVTILIRDCMRTIDRAAHRKYGVGANSWSVWNGRPYGWHSSHGRWERTDAHWEHLNGTKAVHRWNWHRALRGFHLGRRPQDDGKQNEMDIEQIYKEHPYWWEKKDNKQKGHRWCIREGHRPYIEIKLKVKRGDRRPQPLNWSFIKNQKTKNDASNTKTSDGNYYKNIKF